MNFVGSVLFLQHYGVDIIVHPIGVVTARTIGVGCVGVLYIFAPHIGLKAL